MLLANVIFRAFEAAYISWMFLFPLAVVVLVAESLILWFFNRGSSVQSLAGCALVMNVASYAIGYGVSPMLYVDSGLVVVDPDEHGYGVLDRGPNWNRLAQYSFVQAAIVSAIIELMVLLPFHKWANLRHIVVPVILANCLTYLLLGLGFTLVFGN